MTENARASGVQAEEIPATGHEAGITEAMIRALVHAFYARVRRDDTIGPMFNAAISDWDPHLAKLCDFWSSVALSTGRYRGQPMRVHAGLPGISGRHFARWLALFEATARDVCPPRAAAFFIDRAHRIAQSLQLGIAHVRGDSIIGTPLE